MANAFKNAANKGKKPAGGLPEELTAGAGQEQEVVPAAEVETASSEEVREETAPVQEAVKEETAAANDLVAIYEAKKRAEPEARNVRLQAVITPTLNDKLNEMVAAGKIKSKNDLINFLLERYFFGESK